MADKPESVADSVEFPGLNDRQIKAVIALAEGRKASEVRKELEIPTSTWYVWTGRAEFQSALDNLHRAATRDLRARLHHVGGPAIECLAMACDPAHWTMTENGGQCGVPASAVAAARDILDRIGLVALPGASEEKPTTVILRLAHGERSVSTEDVG